ncbi:type II toxin-antitoxin system VapC family toxin [soil metagenome]
MILVDTSVWLDHLRATDPHLVEALEFDEVVQHPMVIGELSLGDLRKRDSVLGLLNNLSTVRVALHHEVMTLVDGHRLFGQGLSLVDVHLLASVLLTPGTRLWTRDKRLARAADHLEILEPDPSLP